MEDTEMDEALCNALIALVSVWTVVGLIACAYLGAATGKIFRGD